MSTANGDFVDGRSIVSLAVSFQISDDMNHEIARIEAMQHITHMEEYFGEGGCIHIGIGEQCRGFLDEGLGFLLR
jgi:hypothetical protein